MIMLEMVGLKMIGLEWQQARNDSKTSLIWVKYLKVWIWEIRFNSTLNSLKVWFILS